MSSARPISIFIIHKLITRWCNVLLCSQWFSLFMKEKLRSHVSELTGMVNATWINMYKFGNTSLFSIFSCNLQYCYLNSFLLQAFLLLSFTVLLLIVFFLLFILKKTKYYEYWISNNKFNNCVTKLKQTLAISDLKQKLILITISVDRHDIISIIY